MEELQKDNWYCTNPECVSYQDANEIQEDANEEYEETEVLYDYNDFTVYVNKDTGKYHQDPNSHKMKSSVPMTIGDAHENGYSACGNCYR